MGIRDFLKGKIDKHGGAAGAAMAAVTKPVRLVTGGHGMRSAEPDASVSPDLIKEALDSVPKEPDADGFVAVAPSSMITEKRPGTFNIEKETVAVYRHGDALHAIDSACTHEDGPLGESEVEEGGIITCPYHDWRFELATGACLTDPSRPVACYAVKEVDGFVWIGHKTSEGSSERGGEHDDGLVMDA